MDKRFKKLIIVFIWLIIWQLVSVLVNNRILLAGPVETAITLFGLLKTSAFYISVLSTLLKIVLGFLAGVVIGSLLAFISYRSSLFKEFIAPFVSAVKSVPVASFAILVLIWVGAPNLSLVISALVVFPIVYLNLTEGLSSTDGELLEMAEVFHMRKRDILFHIYLPHLKPFLISSLGLSCGMAWKSGIAAEVIGRPLSSMGNGINLSKIYIKTSELFAWTFAAVVLAYLMERGVRAALGRLIR